MAIFESSLLLQTIMLGIQPLIFSGVDKSSDQFLIQERVQVLVVGGVEVSVHRLAGAKKWCYFFGGTKLATWTYGDVKIDGFP